jgi:LacI family transcriptional regulator
VPDEVSVVGFDNILAAELVTPALTTVATPLHTEGAEAIRHLLTMVEGGGGRTGRPLVLPTRLVVRATTAPAVRAVRPAGRRPRPTAVADN